jgi:predicted membrane chloride channel (bestrophin family)
MKALNRRKYMNKWMIVKKAMIVAAVLGLIKFGLHIANLEFIEINSIISSLISGVIFTMAILLSGVMTDFKESEKIPGELAASIKALHKDLELLEFMSKNETSSALLHLNSLISVIIRQFETNQWKQSEITQVIEKIDLDIAEMAAKNMAPAYVIKMRNELSNIEKISNRIDTIEETNFLPAAYVLSQTAVFFVVLILLFAIVDPYMIGMFIIFTVTFLIVGILMLIKDMDNPFETGGKGSADVDLSHIYKLDKYLKNHDEVK